MTFPYWSLRVRATVVATLEFIISLMVVHIKCTDLSKLTAYLKNEATNEVEINMTNTSLKNETADEEEIYYKPNTGDTGWATNIYAIYGTIATIGILDMIIVMILLCGIAKPSVRIMRIALISKTITTVVSVIVELVGLTLLYIGKVQIVYVAQETIRDFYSVWIIASHVDELQLSRTVQSIAPTQPPNGVNAEESTH